VTDLSGGRPASSRRSRLYIGGGLALVLLLIVFFVVRSQSADDQSSAGQPSSRSHSTTSTPAAKAGSLARFDGSGDKTTTAFSAASNWEIAWQAQPGSGFTVELLDKDGVSRGEIVTGKKQAKGSTFVSEAGEFKLKVSASSRWKIGIVGRASSK
jgi:hypothetical protein